MELIADILLVAGALGAGLYCFVLSRRLRRFTDLEKGVGGAVAVLSSQADELKRSLDNARAASDQSGESLKGLTVRAESVAQRLELIMASMHDVIPAEDTKPEADIAEPPVGSEPQSEAEDDTAEAVAEPSDEQPEDKPDEATAKAPEGLMFFRHGRNMNEAT
ncbi:hypothetical protein ABLN87_07635 [Ruegeria sp. SCPT10]|uniref:hypothetical protein n=1 Tax=Ruegeria sp. SCP10 TaxID=3141377 RepID=UPI00333CE4FF